MDSQDFLVTGSLLPSSSTSYMVQSILGEGCFGKVAKCMKTATNQIVAVKFMQNMQEGEEELAILKTLSSLDPDTCNIIRWNHTFIHRECMCLEFELLDMSLEDFMQQRKSQPLPVSQIRPILQQCATALKHLKTIGVIHTDLKADNIMMVDQRRQPFRVKIIDFGLACHVSAARQGSVHQPQWYRSPEIMLGLPITEAIDMWSLGVIAAELYLGRPLYPGHNDYDMMRLIVDAQGLPPDHLLSSGQKTSHFFRRDTSSTHGSWRLLTPREVKKERGSKHSYTRRGELRSLDDLKPVSLSDGPELDDRCTFVELLKKMLHLDASERITPSELLEHPFISMGQLVGRFHLSSYVKACFQHMDVCQKQRHTSNTDGLKSTQQPSVNKQADSSTTLLAPQSVAPHAPPDGMQARPLQQTSGHHSPTETWAQSHRSGGKRRRNELEDGETSNRASENQRKRRRLEGGEDRHRSTKASGATLSSTQPTSTSRPLKRKSDRTEEETVLPAKRKR